jgi:hypothetical protein
MKGVGRKITAVAVAAALATAGGVAFRLMSNKGRQEAGSSIFAPLKFTGDDPSVPLLSHGTRVTLQQAVQSAKFTMYRPSAPQASDQSITQVWMTPGPQPDIAIRYASGLRLYYAQFPAGRSSLQDVAAFYSNLAQESGRGWTQTINGHPAWVSLENPQTEDIAPYSVVDIAVGPIEISLQGKFSTDVLVSIAETIG